ncbi:uncharacterized protein [Antedon mediterranea]|uniref:uncharacterized protein n=1 Tax=Antedon mediterranea TaxID=105859 RepID=UPI003AF4CA62
MMLDYFSIYFIASILLIRCQTAEANERTVNDGEVFQAVVNRQTQLTCNFNTRLNRNYWMRWWYIEGEKIVADNADVITDGYSFAYSGTNTTLRIANATQKVEGTYRCYIILRQSKVIGDVSLKLLYPPTTILLNGFHDGDYIEVSSNVPKHIVCMAVRSKPIATFRFVTDIQSDDGTTSVKPSCDGNGLCNSTSSIHITASIADHGKHVTCIVHHPGLNSPLKATSMIEVVDYVVPITKSNLRLTSFIEEDEMPRNTDTTLTLVEDEEVSLQCVVDKVRPAADILIEIDGDAIETQSTTVLKDDDGLYSTEVAAAYTSVKGDDRKIVCCVAKHEYLRIQKNQLVEQKICKHLHVEEYFVPLKDTNVMFYAADDSDQGFNNDRIMFLDEDVVTFKCFANDTRPLTKVQLQLNKVEIRHSVTRSLWKGADGLFTTYASVTLKPHDIYGLAAELCCLATQNDVMEISICTILNVTTTDIDRQDTEEISRDENETQTLWYNSNLLITILCPSILLLLILVYASCHCVYIGLSKEKRNERKKKITVEDYMEYVPESNDYAELNTSIIPDFEHTYEFIQ